MTTRGHSTQSGFTLIEVMVALTLTLIVSGSIFALMTGGQAAFRRTPELTDRQQNIRVALSVIERDLQSAGGGLGFASQVFTTGLDGDGPTGPDGVDTDHLEFLAQNPECPSVPLVGHTGVNIEAPFPFPSCYEDNSIYVVVYADGTSRWGMGHVVHGGGPDNGKKINFPNGQQPAGSQIHNQNDLDNAVQVLSASLYRYEIAADPNDPTLPGLLGLYRSTRGGIDEASGNYVAPPDASGGWVQVARGVELLQVRYEHLGGGGFQDDAGAVAGPATVVNRVDVRLGARTAVAGLEGATQAADGSLAASGLAVRGEVQTTVTIRTALVGAQRQADESSSWDQAWYWR